MGILLAWLIRRCKHLIFKSSGKWQYIYITDFKAHSANFKTYLLIILLSLVCACSTDPQLTPDSTIRITPTSQNYEVEELLDDEGNCILIPDFFQDLPISMTVINGSNQAVGNVNITVFTDFSGNTFSGFESLQLFSDSNGNGVVDSPDELVSGSGDDAFSIRTDRFSGTANLLLRVNLSCEFRGNVYAFSGAAAGISEIGVTGSPLN